MIRSDLGCFYQKRKTDFEIALEKARTEINFVSNLRILSSNSIPSYRHTSHSRIVTFFSPPFLY